MAKRPIKDPATAAPAEPAVETAQPVAVPAAAHAAAPRKSGRPTSVKPPRPRAKVEMAAEASAAKASPVAAEPVEAPAPPEPASEGATAFGAGSFAMPAAEQMQMLETLSMNIARAAMTAQTAFAEAALSKAANPGKDGGAALSPDPFNVGPAMTSVMSSLAARPDKLFSAQADLFNRYMDLWATTTRRASGETSQPPSKDKRFKDAAWSENPMFDMMRQSYLVTSDWMNGLIASVEDVDPLTKRRAEFFTKLLTDAFSPSNFLASNPAALKAMAESNGESLVKGMQNFAADLERGGGKLAISQAD